MHANSSNHIFPELTKTVLPDKQFGIFKELSDTFFMGEGKAFFGSHISLVLYLNIIMV